MESGSILKGIKVLVRRHRFLDKAYLWLRYGNTHPLSSKYWDRIWESEGLNTWRDYPQLFSFICSVVPDKSRVLDVGCGVGILLQQLRRERKCDVFGVDISPKAIDIAGQAGIPGKVCRLPDLPLDTESFDMVIATELLEHLEKPTEAIKEMCRVLRTGGYLIISTPNDCLPPGDCDEHFQCFNERTLSEAVSAELCRVCTKIFDGKPPILLAWGQKSDLDKN